MGVDGGQTDGMVSCILEGIPPHAVSAPLYFQNEKHLKTPKKSERRYRCTISMNVTLILSRTLFATFASSIIELAIIETLIFADCSNACNG